MPTIIKKFSECTGTILLILFLCIASNMPLLAQESQYAVVRTPQNVVVNKALPKNILSSNEIMPATFSKDPTDEEIFRVHFFEEPLVPMNSSVLTQENADLVYALAAFSQRRNPDDFTSITDFLKAYPQTRWRGALLANLGITYRRTGYFNQAMDAWQLAWNLMKDQTTPKIKVLADKVISELLLINAWIGRTEKMDSLLNEIDGRVTEGPGAQRIVAVREALWTMKNMPGISFKCGPYALNKIFTITNPAKAYHEKLMDVQSTAKGFSLAELERLAHEVGLGYQMAFRKPGAVVIEKSVVHWKLDHYSALLEMENGQYKCADATMGTAYGQQFWLTPAALDSSASGYFLVPDGALPTGWRKVMPMEGSLIFGKGQEPPPPGGGPGPTGGGGGGGPCPMAQFDVYLAPVCLHIFDQPLFYSPPKGPALIWGVHYIQRDSYQPANFTYSNMGPKWTFEWLSYVQDDPKNPSANANIYMRDGGFVTFTSYNISAKSYMPQLQTNDVLVRISPSCYELRHPDGSKEIYSRPDGSTVKGRKIFLTQKVDMAGNALNIMYDANLRVTALQDAIGQVTTLKYQNASDIYKITKVTDPFGRSASFKYDDSGRLTSITDMIGIVSSFKYDTSDFINQLTTPYGVTSFFKKEAPINNLRLLEIHYPLGEKERIEFVDRAPGIKDKESILPASPPINLFNSFLNYRNTYFWDKKAMQEAPGDYTKAKIYHWLHGSVASGNDKAAASILESIKKPLENRVWYNYQGQTDPAFSNEGMSAQPSIIGRVLDDSTSQFRQFTYDSIGHVTSSTDALGRKMTYIYDSTNHIDLLEVRQTTNGANELLEKYTYNNQHLKLTARDASGQTTKFTYNAAGQLLTITNPKKEKTTLQYNGDGFLKIITGPVAGSTVKFTYDGYGRVRTITDPEGYTITTDYDALDRPTFITYPDNTAEQIVYDRLDAVHTKDRLGRWSHTIYDSLDRATVIQDALGRITQFIWCTCGSLVEIIDPLKQITMFARDLQGRLTSKTYHDGKSISYKYENTTSRLKEMTDAKGQTTGYSYFLDDNLKQVDYINAQIATPSVAYTYDNRYNRVTSMSDGTGTTNYTYHPAGTSHLGANRVATIDGPLSNDVITYTYDSLGRESSRSINGVASSVVYDALGRTTSAINALGTFGYSYVNQTKRLSSINLPNGQTTIFDYHDNKGDQLLKQIWHKKPNGTTLSKFGYEYNDEGQITKWTQQTGTTDTNYYELGYDLADQLTSATLKNHNTVDILKRYAYQYDKAGNRTSEQIDNSVTSAAYNALNQMTKQKSGGYMRYKGTVNEFSSVLVKDKTAADSSLASVDSATNSFEAFVKVSSGNNNISITATDYSGNNNKKTNNYNVTVTDGANSTLTYDNNGNTISTTNPAVTYGWDAADRLVKIKIGTSITEFVYDGSSRRVAEKLNGTVIKRWLWCGTELCEERNAVGGTVTKRFFRHGEQINGTNYYFTRDHLGSIREMTNGSGAIKTQYDYDPYGRKTKVVGNTDADFGFTGHYFHQASGLYLTLFRAYHVNLGRWLSRDPMKETEGTNLYAYVRNNPSNLLDPNGTSSSSTKTSGTALDYNEIRFGPQEGPCGCGKHLVVDFEKDWEMMNGGTSGWVGQVVVGFGAGVAAEVCKGALKTGGGYIGAALMGWEFGTLVGSCINWENWKCVPD
ncbi:MAG TPA: RHS repeat-associated core domain-containing protein [Parafilimonas sp.]|nr:RHS repeat-associated core domain-containing protein [Parafilimonas sp.]